MIKLLTTIVIALALAYVFTIKNVSLNISNSFFRDLFPRQQIVIQQAPKPESKISLTKSQNDSPVDKKGTLRIRSDKKVTVMLIGQNVDCNFGPKTIEAKKDFRVEIEKGYYKAEVFDGVKRRIETVSFLGENGTLDL